MRMRVTQIKYFINYIHQVATALLVAGPTLTISFITPRMHV